LFEKDGFYKKEKYNKSVALDTIKTFTRKTKVEYSLVIVDEFQNYSQDQLEIINIIINKDSKSLTYIGDLNQKNTLKPLSVKHNTSFFDDCEKVHLSKVYRNTKQILSYIKNLGYDITVPAEAREGDEVSEIKIENNLSTKDDLECELLNVLNLEIEKIDKKYTIGILCDDPEIKIFLENNFKKFTEDKNLNFRIMTKSESQGTEFNTAIVINGGLNNVSDFTGKFEKLKKQVKKNNDYVGYTRAVEKLIVIKI
jgi:superfamily I DNA/RNA helicase